jgi:hypothetical protein
MWNPLDATKHGFAASKSIIDSFFFDKWSQITSSSQKVKRGRRNRQSNHDDVRKLCESLILSTIDTQPQKHPGVDQVESLTTNQYCSGCVRISSPKISSTRPRYARDSVVTETIHTPNDDERRSPCTSFHERRREDENNQ